MRLLIYGINYAPELTGIGRYTGEMAEWLAGRGHEVRVVTAPPYYPHWKVSPGYSAHSYRRDHKKGVTVWRCPLWVPQRPSGASRLLHLATFAISSAPVVLSQAGWSPDIVFAVEPPFFGAPAAVLGAWTGRARSWLHVQDFEVDAAFELGLLRGRWMARTVRWLESVLMRRFDRVSTISNRMIRRVGDKGVPEDRRILFPNWVDTAVIRPLDRPSDLRAELGLGDRDVVALYSGNMGKKQGLGIVIDAARQLSKVPTIHFVMCGNGVSYEELRSRAADLPNLTWLPVQPEGRLNELLNLADIHLLPQRPDAADLVMPSKLTGMLASGRPVVATARMGTELWDLVQVCGIVTNPGDAGEFREAITRLATDSTLRERLGTKGRGYATRHLDREVVLRRFEADLIALIGGRHDQQESADEIRD